MSSARAVRLSFALLLATIVPRTAAGQEAVTQDAVRALLAQGLADQARSLIQSAPNRDRFLATPAGQAWYAGALCFSQPASLAPSDVDNALAYVRSATEGFAKTADSSADWTAWLSTVGDRCKQILDEVARVRPDAELVVAALYSGKTMGGCKIDNPSPSFIAAADRVDDASILKSFSWVPLPVAPPGATPSTAAAARPPAAFLDSIRKDHAAADPHVAVCAPFIAVSSAQDPADLCRAASRFLDHLRGAFPANGPGAWTVLHHYATQDELRTHAQKHGGPPCSRFLGYYDHRAQTIAFRADSGLFGTLQHELTHAFLFWALPRAPRWFDEGLAAVFENTDSSYNGQPNPWREAILQTIQSPRDEFFDRVLGLSLLEFERSPEPATVSRAVLMQVQRAGGLAGVFRDLRAADGAAGPAASRPPMRDRPTDEMRRLWADMVRRRLPQ